MPEKRQALHVYLTLDAHGAFHEVAEGNGISASALVEQMSRDWGERLKAGEDPADILPRTTVQACRKIDAARRRRGGS